MRKINQSSYAYDLGIIFLSLLLISCGGGGSGSNNDKESINLNEFENVTVSVSGGTYQLKNGVTDDTNSNGQSRNGRRKNKRNF